ncbi:MAG: hypothetical protein RLZZ475_2875 [Pseudomonadota bacterium]|jgi:hypothetical protein
MTAAAALAADILTLPLFAWAYPMPKRRSDGRFHDTGLVRPYRPCPADFRERFLEMGQSKEIEEHYRTNWRCIARWIEEAGGDTLRAERRKQSGGTARPNLRRARRYVLGMTLTEKTR